MTQTYQKAGWIALGLAAVAGVSYMAWRYRNSFLAQRHRADERHKDGVDIANAESFPASDPPAFSANRAN